MRALFVAAMLLPATVVADPVSRLAVVAGRREYFGDIGERWSGGWLRGVEAGIQPGWMGLAWALYWTRLDADPDISTLGTIDTWQIDLAARARARVPLPLPAQTFLYTQLGATILRTEVPLTEGAGAGSTGAITGAGIEAALGGVQIGLGAGFTIHFDGSASVDIRLSIGYGRVEQK